MQLIGLKGCLGGKGNDTKGPKLHVKELLKKYFKVDT